MSLGDTMATATRLKMRIEGMDCASCAIKIETAIKRLPGISDLDVNAGSGMLTLMIDEDRTSRSEIVARVKRLGYTPVEKTEDHRDGHPHDADDGPWWCSTKAMLAALSGLLCAAAFTASHVYPEHGRLFFTIAAAISVLPFMRRAVAGAILGAPFSIEMLMGVAAVGAIIIGEAAEAAAVVFLFAIGELLENVAAGHARAGIKALVNLVPRMARREEPDGVAVDVAAAKLAIGDVVQVRPGDRVPSDGEIIEGHSDLDESPVTGESVPITKAAGAAVFAGSVNGSGMLRIRITRTAADNTIARIIHLVEEAQQAKAPTARFIDRFAARYTPAAMIVGALIAIVPPLFFGAEWQTWVYRGLATLLIACPCAMVISTPAAIASGLAAGARRGLLIKGGAALESLGHIKTAAFDKTGTLTRGRPEVTDVLAFAEPEDAVLAKAAAVERGSSHPLGLAIIEAAEERLLEIPHAFGTMAVAGKSVRARLRDGFVAVGSPSYAEDEGALDDEDRERIAALESEGKTVVAVVAGNRLLGLVALRDTLREDAVQGVAQIKAMGIRPIMLTGDNRRAANAVASQLGIDFEAELMPEAKLATINRLKEQGPVAMAGDGINDAPALSTANVGIAMGSGTDVALETADAAILKDRVTGVAELVALARATLVNIRQNVTIAIGLKAVFLVTTLAGMTSLWMAILADTGATVLVTANALRLLRFGSKR
jgi:Cd2+/Zn2+-exporting ATPase